MKTRTIAFWTLVACTTPALTASAQDAPKPPKPAATDPNAVRRDLYDITLLYALQKVNLSEDQIQAMAKVTKEVLDKDKERRAKDDEAVREIAEEVKKAREGALQGDRIPTELETKFTEIQKAVIARIGSAKRDSVEKILTILWPTLTADQKTEMEKLSIAFYGVKRIPAAYRAKPKDAPRDEVLKLAAGAFVENFLLDDRMPTLLESLKPLKTATTEGGGGATGSGTSTRP